MLCKNAARVGSVRKPAVHVPRTSMLWYGDNVSVYALDTAAENVIVALEARLAIIFSMNTMTVLKRCKFRAKLPFCVVFLAYRKRRHVDTLIAQAYTQALAHRCEPGLLTQHQVAKRKQAYRADSQLDRLAFVGN